MVANVKEVMEENPGLWIKQNLKIKFFLGASRNAVMTQIWVAMCMYLLLAYIRFMSKLGLGMQQILRLL